MKLPLCIVGCGRYAANVVLKEIHDMTGEFDFYFASRNLSKAKDYCERFGGIDYFGSYEEALSDARDSGRILLHTSPYSTLQNTELAASPRQAHPDGKAHSPCHRGVAGARADRSGTPASGSWSPKTTVSCTLYAAPSL